MEQKTEVEKEKVDQAVGEEIEILNLVRQAVLVMVKAVGVVRERIDKKPTFQRKNA